MVWPGKEDACPNIPTRYCDWDCEGQGSCFRFPWKEWKAAADA